MKGLLTRRNNLADELGRLNARLGALTDTINTISRHDAQIRVLASLEPLKPEVHSAGIGGPAAPRPSWVDADPAVRARRPGTGGHQRAGPPGQPAVPVVRRSGRQPGIAPGPDGRDAVDHADAGLAHERVLSRCASIRSCTWRGRTRASTSRPRWARRSRRRPPASWRSPGRETGYGNVIIIDHGFGIRTKYAHCSKLIVGAGAQGDAGPADRTRGQHRPLHRSAPALRGAGERPAGRSASVHPLGSRDRRLSDDVVNEEAPATRGGFDFSRVRFAAIGSSWPCSPAPSS